MVCSASLNGRRAGETVYPPRARDRSLWQRWLWSVTSSPRLESLKRRNHAFWTGVAGGVRWLGIREMGLLLLSVIPGLGHIAVLGQLRRGLLLFFGTVAAVVLGVFLYRTPVLDCLAYLILLASMWSVYLAVNRLRPSATGQLAMSLERVGIALLIVALYLGSYIALRYAVRPWYITVRVLADAPIAGTVSAGDSLLIRRDAIIRRGDLVIATCRLGRLSASTISPVVGMPGDTIEVGPVIKVNGVPTGFTGWSRRVDGFYPAVTLGKDQYWVMPNLTANTNDPDVMATAGTVSQSDVWGRAIAVIGPPSHRRLLR